MCLLGFLIADMASFNSASTFALLSAFVSTMLVVEALLERTLRDLSCSCLLLCGMLPRPSGSLPSRFKPGIVAGVADLILASGSTGLRDAFHFCWSFSKTFSRDRDPLVPDTDLFKVDPGFATAFSLGTEGLWGFGGDAATGPPNFLLSAWLNSGSRAAKLGKSTNGISTKKYNSPRLTMAAQYPYRNPSRDLNSFCRGCGTLGLCWLLIRLRAFSFLPKSCPARYTSCRHVG